MRTHPKVLAIFVSAFLMFSLSVGSLSLDWYTPILLSFPFFLIGSYYLFGRISIFGFIIFIMIISFGYGRGNYQFQLQKSHLLPYQSIVQDNKIHSIEGEIEKILYQSDFTTTYRHKIAKIDNISTQDRHTSPYILLEVPKNTHLDMGDLVKFQSKLKSIYDFDKELRGFERYTWKEGLLAQAKPQNITILKKGTQSFIETLGKDLRELISHSFPQKNAAIILGISIGNTDFMTKEVKNQFQLSGITHILVVSGSNIAFLILFMTFFLKYFSLKRAGRIVVISIFLLFYGTLVSWDIPVIRATIMGLIAYLGIEYGEKISSIVLLFIVACIFCFINPMILLYDPGFGLSFGATLGILIFQDFKPPWMNNNSLITFFYSLISLTLGASLGSVGVIIYHFGNFSFGSILSNIIIGPIMGILLFLSVGYIIASLLVPTFILYVLGIPLYILTTWIGQVAYFFSFSLTWKIPEEYIPYIGIFSMTLLFGLSIRSIMARLVHQVQKTVNVQDSQ